MHLLRRLALDRIQVDRSLLGRRPSRTAGPTAHPALLPSLHPSRCRDRYPLHPPAASRLGTRHNPRSFETRAPQPSSTGAQHRRRDPPPQRPPAPPTAPQPRSPWPWLHSTLSPQCRLDRRLQGPVQDPQRPLLLPPHHPRRLLSLLPRLPGPPIHQPRPARL